MYYIKTDNRYVNEELFMIQRFIRDVKKYSQYSLVSAKSQLKSEVASSYLNWIWWILEPLCFMLIYSFVFGYLFHSREPYFSVYIFVGLTMWNFFSKTVQSSVKIVKINKSIVSKVYFPKYILILTRILVNGFKMAICFGIVAVMMIVNRIPLSFNVFYAIPILVTLVLLTFGCSCFMLHWGVFVNDLANAIAIIMKMVFYTTGVFFNLETRIPQYGAILNRYIPTAYLLSSMRQSLIYGTTPDVGILVLWFVVSLLLCVAGVRTIYKEENSYVKAI